MKKGMIKRVNKVGEFDKSTSYTSMYMSQWKPFIALYTLLKIF
jgi:hypothetical protein